MTLHMVGALLEEIPRIVKLFTPGDGGSAPSVNWGQIAYTRSLAAKYKR